MGRDHVFALGSKAFSTGVEDELWDADAVDVMEDPVGVGHGRVEWIGEELVTAETAAREVTDRDWFVPSNVGRLTLTPVIERDHPLDPPVIVVTGPDVTFDPLGAFANRRSTGSNRMSDPRVRSVASLWNFIRDDPVRFMRLTLYLLMFLAVLSSFTAVFGGGLMSVLLAAGILITWGVASLLLYAASGTTILNPLLGTLALIAGFGTLGVAAISYLV